MKSVEESQEAWNIWENQSAQHWQKQEFLQINPPSEIDLMESLLLQSGDQKFLCAPNKNLDSENVELSSINGGLPSVSSEEDNSTIGQSSLGQDATSQKSACIKSTNSMKNFIMNFVKYISSEESGAKIKFMKIQEINPDSKKFKKLVECLKKKIKKDKHTVDHLRSLLGYKDRYYTEFILDICQEFLIKYPQIVKRSSRMGNDNLSIIPAVCNLLKFQRDSILYVNFNTKNPSH